MNITSDKLNCYIEGIRFPVQRFEVKYDRNVLSEAIIRIPIGEKIYHQLWAQALTQITYLQDNKEKLLYQGLITDMNIVEDESFIILYLSSIFSTFNLNTTLDYIAPRKYGIGHIDSEIKIYIGNEAVIERDNGDSQNFKLSNRYFFLPESYKEKEIPMNDPQSFKLQYIIDRTPFAEKFAFSFLEQMAYSNFILTKAHVERLNLLAKTEKSLRIKKFEENIDKTLETTAYFLELDSNRAATVRMKILSINNKKIDTTGKTGTTVKLSFSGLSEEFKTAVNEMSQRLNIESDWILAVMNFETDGTFSPSKKNKTNGATGLIQFMPKYAPGDVGKTVQELAQMTQIEQLKYVEIYLEKKGGSKLKSLEDVAMCIFYPVAIGNPDYKFPANVVQANNGISTPKEYVRRVILAGK